MRIDGGDPTRMAWRYRLALGLVAALAIGSFLVLTQVISRERATAGIINVSGQQRFLSQRGALFVGRLTYPVPAQDQQDARQHLAEVIAQMRSNHEALLKGGSGTGDAIGLSPAMARLFHDEPSAIDRRVREYLAAMEAVLTDPRAPIPRDAPAVALVLREGPGPLLDVLDHAVARFQAEGEAAVDRLHDLHIALLIATLLTLALEALLIFQPMATAARRRIRELENASLALKAAAERLEREVAARTVELQKAKEHAERANVAKARFLATAGHDLLQPIESLRLLAGSITRRNRDPALASPLDDMRKALSGMRGLLGNLLDTARLDTGSVTPQLQDVDPAALVDDLAREFEPVADDKGLGFGVGISLAEGLRIRTDPVITGRILRNFLSNAVRYTPAGSVTLTAGPAELDGRPAVRFTVADTGPGIDPADQERIFAEFTQIDDARRDRSAGVGLGLSIARRMAQILEHELTLDSRPGEGARFALTVPLAPAARRPLRSSEKPIPADD